MDEYNNNGFRTAIAHIDILREPNLILAVICSLVSKLLSQDSDTIAKATEEVLRTYKELDAIEELKQRSNDSDKAITANSTLLFDKNVATDSSLSPIDKAVYSVLCALVNPETYQCSPKVKTIATKASCSESAVRKSLATLEKHKVIKRKFRYINHRQISSLYTVIRAEAETITSCEENIETHIHSNTTSVETEKNSAVELDSNSTEEEYTCFFYETRKIRLWPSTKKRATTGNTTKRAKRSLESLKIP